MFKQSSIKQIFYLLPDRIHEIRKPDIPSEETNIAPYFWMVGSITGTPHVIEYALEPYDSFDVSN
jgi:hypothetical protein